MHDTAPAIGVRPVSRGMHVLLYVLTALTFFAGTQLFVLSDHTETFFSWTILNPMSAAFIGAGFWGASVVVFWCARQRAWTRGRVVVPTVAVVATMLMVGTLQNLEAFHGLLGLAWIEVYSLFPPILAAITIMQLIVPGIRSAQRRSGAGRAAAHARGPGGGGDRGRRPAVRLLALARRRTSGPGSSPT